MMLIGVKEQTNEELLYEYENFKSTRLGALRIGFFGTTIGTTKGL